MNTNAIENYIFKNPQNLKIASMVSDTLVDARQKVVSRFLDKLENQLKKKLKGWNFERWGGVAFTDSYPGFYISKPNWKQYSVALQYAGYGRRVVIGIARETNNLRKLPHQPALLNAFQKIYPEAKSYAWWEAKINLRAPLDDWTKPETLWQLHKSNKVLSEIVEFLLEVAEAGGPIIDGFSPKK